MSTLFNIGDKISTTTEALLPVQKATAGYSLRNIGIKGYNQPVVKVVRELDSAEEDFTASEVSDGTLVDWVNGDDTIIYQSDFSEDEDGFSNTRTSITANETFEGETEVLKVTVGSVDDNTSYIRKGMFVLLNKYTVTCKVYIPSGNTNVNRLQIYTGFGTDVEGGISNYLITTTDEWVNVNLTFIPGSLPTSSGTDLRFWASENFNLNLPSSAQGDVFYVKDIEVTRIGSLGQVKVWYDQFGDNNATQNTVSEMPKIVSFGALITENGKPALDMNNGKMNVSTITLSTMSLFFVYLRGGEDFILTGDTLASRHRLQVTATRIYINNTDYLSGITDTSQIQKLYTTLYSSGNLDTYENSSQNNFSSGGSFTGVTGNYIIENLGDELDVRPADGLMQEIIIYDSDQSANKTKIENNINSYYNIYS
jgi:hypothetical protein